MSFLLGWLRNWSVYNIILFSFIISLSSSAIILEYLYKNKELGSQLGLLTTGILVLQDFLIAPMLLTINFMAEGSMPPARILTLLAAIVVIILFLRNVVFKRKMQLPFPESLQKDHELQVFTGLLICFGFAWFTHILGLSAALGALLGGIFISRVTSMHWLENSLVPFRVFFLSLFFLSVGLQINVSFLLQHAGLVLVIVSIILLVNSVINAAVFRLLGVSWQNSIYAGALLSQIGEFSLVLCLVGKQAGIMDNYFYQLTLAVVTMTMLFTAIWINIIRSFIYRRASHVRKFLQSVRKDNSLHEE